MSLFTYLSSVRIHSCLKILLKFCKQLRAKYCVISKADKNSSIEKNKAPIHFSHACNFVRCTLCSPKWPKYLKCYPYYIAFGRAGYVISTPMLHLKWKKKYLNSMISKHTGLSNRKLPFQFPLKSAWHDPQHHPKSFCHIFFWSLWWNFVWVFQHVQRRNQHKFT